MKQMLTVAGLQFRLVFKSRSSLAVMLMMPLIFVLIFGSLMGNGGGSGQGQIYRVAVVDQDQSHASRLLFNGLKEQDSLAIETAALAEMNKLFGDKVIAAGIVIPAGFAADLAAGRSTEIRVLAAPGGNLAMAITPTIQREAARVSSDYRLALAMIGAPADEVALQAAFDRVQADRQRMSVSLNREAVYRETARERQHSGTSHASLGFTVMFVMMLVFMQGGVILRERQGGTWGRLLTTPAGRLSVLGGYLLSFFLIGIVQFTLLVIATRYLFGVHWGSLLPLYAVAASFVLCSAGLGLFVAGMVKTSEQQATFGTIAVVATSMLGGVYWPLEIVGPTMQRIGYLTPQAWAMTGLTEVMLRDGSFSSLLWPITVLLSLTVIFMTAGLLRVRYE